MKKMTNYLLLMLIALLFISQKVDGKSATLQHVQMHCQVSHRYARTEITATLQNSANKAKRVSFKQDIPEGALVSKILLETDGKNFTGLIQPRNKRKRETKHKEVISKMDTIYLHRRKDGRHTFHFITEMQPKGIGRLYLVYEKMLQRKKGVYQLILPATLSEKPGHLEINVTIQEQEMLINFTLLSLPNGLEFPLTSLDLETEYVTVSRPHKNIVTLYYSWKNISMDEVVEQGLPLVLSYDVARFSDGGEILIGGNYFVHFFAPEGLPKIPVHTVFVLDVSGSMGMSRKLEGLKVAMEAILRGLEREDSFEIIVFSTLVKSLGTYNYNRVEEGVRTVKKLKASGGTNINEALIQGLGNAISYKTESIKQVVFLTDGKATVSEKDPKMIRANVAEKNKEGIPIFSLAFGNEADLIFLLQLSSENKGFSRKIHADKQPANQLKEFFEEVSAPLVRDVDISYKEGEVDIHSIVKVRKSTFFSANQITPRTTSVKRSKRSESNATQILHRGNQDSSEWWSKNCTFYSGNEMVVTGRLRLGVKSLTPVITGRVLNGPLKLNISRLRKERDDIPLISASVERLWAYLSVKDLLNAYEIIEEKNLRHHLRAKAFDIAMTYHFLTRETTFAMSEVTDNATASSNAKTYQKFRGPQKHGGSQAEYHSNIDEFSGPLTLMTDEEVMGQLLPEYQHRATLMTSQNRRYSFVDNDPHFVVQVPGFSLPLCFDLHGEHGDVFSLVRDTKSGIIVNGEVSSAAGRPKSTYFTKLFLSLGPVNLTITPGEVAVQCIEKQGSSEITAMLDSTWTFRRHRRSRRNRRIARKTSNRPCSQNCFRRKHHFRDNRKNLLQNVVATKSTERDTANQNTGVVIMAGHNNTSKNLGRSFYGNKGGNLYSYIHPHSNDRRYSASQGSHNPLIKETRQVYHNSGNSNNQEFLNHSFHERQNYTSHQHQLPLNHKEKNSHITNVVPIPSKGNHYFNKRAMEHRQHSTKDRHLQNHKQPDSHNERSHQLKEGEMQNQKLEFQGGKDSLNRDRRQTKSKPDICQKKLTWRQASGHKFDDLILIVKRKRKLNVIMGDLSAHFTVTNAQNKHGQRFLGFYIEEDNVLSPNTTGVIGQFAFKTVGRRRMSSFPSKSKTPRRRKTIRLAVVHTYPRRQYKVSEVNAYMSERRSFLHKQKVSCLHIRRHGRGLLSGSLKDYILPCLSC